MAKKPAKTETESKAPAPAPRTGTTPYPLQQFRDEMDRLFDGFFNRSVFQGTGGRDLWSWEPFRELGGDGRFAAPIDLKESESGYTLEAELPGMSEKDIELELHDGVLTLKGEKRSERDEKKDDYHVTERSFGSVRRTIRVPEGVEEDKISADFKNGVLTVTLPKSKEARKKARKIAVKG